MSDHDPFLFDTPPSSPEPEPVCYSINWDSHPTYYCTLTDDLAFKLDFETNILQVTYAHRTWSLRIKFPDHWNRQIKAFMTTIIVEQHIECCQNDIRCFYEHCCVKSHYALDLELINSDKHTCDTTFWKAIDTPPWL